MIDIILPCRNAPSVVALALTHLWAYGRIGSVARSVTLLDNASTDPAMPALLDYVARLDRHMVIRHEDNVGVWASVNRGLALHDDGLVLVLTSDVLIGPETLPTLLAVQRETGVAFLSPDCLTGLARYAELLRPPLGQVTLEAGYNGSTWLMDWKRLREEVGWFDPQFYIAFGDSDLIERLVTKATETQDARWMPQRIAGLPTIHLDKQSRRHDHTAEADVEMEVRDAARFHAKWQNRPDILARHPMVNREKALGWKAAELGGWEAARIS